MRIGGRIVGLKDSSGDMAYAREAAGDREGLRCVPLDRGGLHRGARRAFAGCISATANLNADLCQRAWGTGDAAALETAVTIRKLFDGKPLVSGVKATLAQIHGEPAWARVAPPLAAVPGRRPGRRYSRATTPRGPNGWPERPFSQALTPAAGAPISLHNRRRSFAAPCSFNA